MERTLSGSLVFSRLFFGLFVVFGDFVFYLFPLAGCTPPGGLCNDLMRYTDLVRVGTYFFECEA